MADPAGSMRVDKWLWAARFFKSRTLASAACAGGKVDVNDEAARPARMLRPGDVLKVTIGSARRIARVTSLSERRGPASQARAMYEDLTPPQPPRARMPAVAWRPMGAGRPTKRERRALDRLRGD